VVYKQVQLLQVKNLGYNRDNIILFKREGKLNESLEPFLQEVRRIPGVINASNLRNDLTFNITGTTGVSWEGQAEDERVNFKYLTVNYDLLETLGVELKEGRTFSREFGNDESKIIFNEAAIESMGLTDPIGKTVSQWRQEKEIIGVVKNFNFESLHERVKPCFIQLSDDGSNIMVKIASGREVETIGHLREFYKAYNLGLPFDFKFLDDDYQAAYESEIRVGVLAKYFAGLAIVISCLGLFGLAAFTAQTKLKEIGIRKVLGASELGIVKILSSDFTKMVVIAIAIALPVGYLIANRWLQNFAYHIDLKWWYFAGAGLVTLFVAWFTVGMQTAKAAMVNPVECLKEE